MLNQSAPNFSDLNENVNGVLRNLELEENIYMITDYPYVPNIKSLNGWSFNRNKRLFLSFEDMVYKILTNINPLEAFFLFFDEKNHRSRRN